MKLLGRNVDGRRLVAEIRARLSARGIPEDVPDAPLEDEATAEPYGFLVQSLEQNADPAQAPPAVAPPGPIASLVRYAARGLLEDLFGRQRAFNTHVRDLAAQLSSELLALRARLAELEERSNSKVPAVPPKNPRKPRRRPARTGSLKSRRN
jgi:hypothetical protein